MANAREVKVPDIGDFTDVPVIEVLVSEGDKLVIDQPLVTLESDKATMDVPAPFAGNVAELKVAVGDEVSEGSVLMVVEAAEDGDGAQTATAAAPEAEAATEPPPHAERRETGRSVRKSDARDGGGPIYASPAVRRLARELKVDLAGLKGTGRKGRITKADIKQAKERPAGVPAEGAGIAGLNLAPWPKVDFTKYGEVERVPLSRIKKISGPNVARNWVFIPHVTHNDEADITDLEAFRKQINAEQQDVKVTMVALLVKACVGSLRQFPDFNASLDGDDLVIKRYYNIGFAADTPQGLMVPVIKDADRKGLLEIAGDLTELSGKAREGRISAEEMRGSTFTISSLGGIGGTSFTPIVNAPDVAILGVTRSQTKPVWNREAEDFEPRLMLPLSLSYDHRVIDGAAAARFVARLIVPLSLSYDHRVIDGALAARFTTHLAGVLADMRRALL